MARGTIAPDDAKAHVEYAKWICETKRAFDSRQAAREVATKRLDSDFALRALYAYRCPACRRLHLTRKKIGSPLAVRHPSSEAPAQDVAAARGPDEPKESEDQS